LPPIEAMTAIGEGFYITIVYTQLTLVVLAAPAATAGAICQDKASGTLLQLLATDLSDTEIVLGKLAARLVPVVGLVCCTLPVLALATLLGGIDPEAVTGVFLITTSMAVFSCVLAVTFSIWGSKTYEVLLATYASFCVWLLSLPTVQLLRAAWAYPPLPRWVIMTNPFGLAVAPYVQPGRKFGLVDDLIFSAILLAISAALVILAIARMRTVVVKQADFPATRDRRRRWPGIRDTRLSTPTALAMAPRLDRALFRAGDRLLCAGNRRMRPALPMVIRMVHGLRGLISDRAGAAARGDAGDNHSR
jgi:ABC-type transport system involved in multi-copper enzyme maturation permease subunit